MDTPELQPELRPHEFSCKPYTPFDYVVLKKWCHERGLPTWSRKYVPETGVLGMYQDQIVSIGFLRQMEGSMALLDGLIADPTQPDWIRDYSLNQVVQDLIEICEFNAIGEIIAFTNLNVILKRAEKFGFEKKSSEMIVLKKTV